MEKHCIIVACKGIYAPTHVSYFLDGRFYVNSWQNDSPNKWSEMINGVQSPSQYFVEHTFNKNKS